MLWALVHLKVYSTVEIHCSIVGWPSAKTYSKWSWYFVKRIAELKDEIISLDNRFDGLGNVAHTNCFMSIDGTDCPLSLNRIRSLKPCIPISIMGQQSSMK